MSLSVYIAAASTPGEIERAKRCADQLRAAGIAVTSTWWETIAQVGAANPRDAMQWQRHEWAKECTDQISVSDYVWLLVPPPDVMTRGAWVEIGYGLAHGEQIVSSGDTKQSIFCAMGREFSTDEYALSYLKGLR